MVKNDKFDELTEKYMPSSDNADTLAGELLRAANRIIYRYYNDGDMCDYGYGKETVNPAVRFLIAEGTPAIKLIAKRFFDFADNKQYKELLQKLADVVTEQIEKNNLTEVENTKDMWDYADPDLDKDDEEEDWEDNYYEEDDLYESLTNKINTALAEEG